jgi:hypothetical protein
MKTDLKANPFEPARDGSVQALHCAHCSARGSPDTNTFPDDTDGSRAIDTYRLPELHPRISRRTLKTKEEEADSILGQAEFSYGDANVLLNWLSEHRFYISQSLCEKANRIREARKKKWDEGKVNFFFEINPFEPHPVMSDDYLEE